MKINYIIYFTFAFQSPNVMHRYFSFSIKLIIPLFILFYAGCSSADKTKATTHHKTVSKKNKNKTARTVENQNPEPNKKPTVKPKNDVANIKPRNETAPPKSNSKEYEKYLIEKYSTELGTTESYIRRNIEVYKFVNEWVGTKYRYGGIDKNGVDCSGLAKAMFEEVYKQTLTRDAGSQYQQCEPVKKSDLVEGDLVFFKIGSRSISHVGIYLANNKFVHASTSKGVMISDLTETYYSRYFFSGGRLKN